MNLEVRKAQSGDAPIIAALEKENFSIPQSESEIEKMINSESNRLLVCECDGAFAGYAGAYTVCRESDVVTICVAPAFRRKGVARVLLSELFASLKGESDALFLEVRESNAPARALYTSLGFLETGIRKGYYSSPKENAILYKKEL